MGSPVVRPFLTIAASVLAAVALAPTPVAAQPAFTVFDNTDAVDTAIGDGICATATGGCTLRAAIMEANASPGGDTVVIAVDRVELTLAGAFEDSAARGDLDIIEDLTILGRARPVVRGGRGFGDRVFDVAPGHRPIRVRIDNLTVAHGAAFSDGGGVKNGDTADLTLVRVRVVENQASGAVANFGGGIDNSGSLTLHRSEVSSNAVAGNALSVGGGISNTGTLTVSASSITDNHADGTGGGIDNGASGAARISESTIARNTAQGPGGGIWNRGELTAENATISGNEAGPWGGGINNSVGNAVLTHVTITENSAGVFGSGINSTGGTVEVRNTLIAGSALPIGQDCAGTLTSAGGNLDGGTTCALTAASDISGAAPLLTPLASDGGPTATHRPAAASPAIDAGAAANCTPRDQRGAPRPQGPSCDIGAYELEP